MSRLLHTNLENYAREILNEQRKQGWGGLTSEVVEICLQTGLQNACLQYVGRKEVEEAMINHHLVEIREEMKPLSKTEEIMKKRYKKDAKLHETKGTGEE